MSTDTPTPERVTLSDEERDELACVATGHEPDLCDCHDGYRDNGDRFCECAQETFTAVERILAAREQALRKEIRSLVTASKATVHGRLALADTLTDWLAR